MIDVPGGGTTQEARVLDVLVVDDEESVLSVVEQLTVALGHHVRVAESGPAALELLAAASSDVVISDIRMPGMDGFELVERIRSIHPNMQIILMTGYSLNQTSDMATQLKVTAVLHKPFKARDLNDALAQIGKRNN